MSKISQFTFKPSDFKSNNIVPTMPLDENATISQIDKSDTSGLVISPESTLACLAKLMEVPYQTLDIFVAALRLLSVQECDLTRVLRDVKDWSEVVRLYPESIGSINAIIRASGVGGSSAIEYWMAAHSLYGCAFAYTHVGPPEALVALHNITKEANKVLEDDESIVEEVITQSQSTDDCFESLSALVPGLPVDIKSWQAFEEHSEVDKVLRAEKLSGFDFSRSSPTGKKYYNNVHPSIASWPKGDEGLIRAAAGAASDLFARPLCVFYNSKIPTKRIVQDSSLFDRALYPENLVRIQSYIDADDYGDPNLLSIGLASLHDDFNFAEFQHERYLESKRASNYSSSEKERMMASFDLDALGDYSGAVLEAILEDRPMKRFQSILPFFKPSASSSKEIVLNPSFIHICSLTEAMTVGSLNQTFLAYQFDLTNYVLMVPVEIFSRDYVKSFQTVEKGMMVPRNSPVLDSCFQDDEEEEMLVSSRIFYFPFVSPTSLAIYQDSNRACLITALLARGEFARSKSAYSVHDVVMAARVTVRCDIAHLNNMIQLALNHGYTTQPVFQMNTMGTSRYKKFTVNSGISSVGPTVAIDFSQFNGNKGKEPKSPPPKLEKNERDQNDLSKDTPPFDIEIDNDKEVVDIFAPPNYTEDD